MTAVTKNNPKTDAGCNGSGIFFIHTSHFDIS